MAQLPTKYDLGGPDSFRTGRTYAAADTTAVGAGMQALGRGVANLGNSLGEIAVQRRQQNLAASIPPVDAGFKTAALDFERELDSDTDYQGIGKKFDDWTRQNVAQFANKIEDPRAREAWINDTNSWLVGRRNTILNGATQRAKSAQVVSNATALDQYSNIYVDPNQSETERAQAGAHILATIEASEKSGLISPETAYSWRQKYVNGSEISYATLWAKQNAGKVGSSGNVLDDVTDKIIHGESRGNPNAKNPRSSAEGVGQFLDGTWVEKMRKYRPDIAAGKTDDELIALKTNEALGREMTRAYVGENAAYLVKAGLEPTEGNIYLAHFAGPEGAKNLLTADPNASASSYFTEKAMKANPHLQGKTVGQVIDWANSVMGQASPGDLPPNWDKLTPEDKADWLEKANQIRTKQTAEEKATEQAVKQSQIDNYNLRIANQDVTLTPQEILTNGALDNGDKATLINSLREKNKDSMNVAALLSSMGDGSAVPEPFDTKAQGVVDKAYESVLTASGQNDATAAQSIAENFARQKGITPKPYLDSIRAGLMSQDVNQVLTALQRAQRLDSASNTAFERDGASSVKTAAVDFKHMIDDLGYTPQEAAAHYIRANDPANPKLLSEKDVNKVLDKVTVSTITGMFDTATSWEPEAGFDARQQAAMVADYRDLLRRELLDTADPTLAEGRAQEKFKRLYGRTDVTGSGHVIKYPPENYNVAINGSYQWLQDQILEDARQASGNLDLQPSDLMIAASDDSARRVAAGLPPAYTVGIWNTDVNGQRYPDALRIGFGVVFDPTEPAKKAAVERDKNSYRDYSLSREQALWGRGQPVALGADAASIETVSPEDIPANRWVGAGRQAVPVTVTMEERKGIADEQNAAAAEDRAQIERMLRNEQAPLDALNAMRAEQAQQEPPPAKPKPAARPAAPLMGAQRDKNLKGNR